MVANMGLFDTVLIKMPLPDDAPEFVKKCPVFQTYDLGRGMGEYFIDEDGKLWYEANDYTYILCEAFGVEPKDVKPILCNYKRKKLELDASNIRGGRRDPETNSYVMLTENGEDACSIVYTVQIRNGKVSSIKEKHRKVEPAKKFDL
jgi:hypothetical protein